MKASEYMNIVISNLVNLSHCLKESMKVGWSTKRALSTIYPSCPHTRGRNSVC